jgi:cysteine desulfurase
MRIYLDHSATTPIDARVLDAMLPYLRDKFGNASSVHQFGQETRAAVDKARRQVASLINSRANEVIFTSGGTEANNLAIRGICEVAQQNGRHIITSAIEHPSVRGVIDYLEKHGWSITRLPVYENGIVRLDEVHAALRDDTVLISVMMANNEIGTIQPIGEIGSLVRAERDNGRKHLWFHTDAVQAAGRIPIDVEAIGCDLLSLSAHKIYAPKGTGALFVRRGVRLFPQQIGGHQERERRAGTESVANIVAFGRAAELAHTEMQGRDRQTKRLRDRFEDEVKARITDIILNGDRDCRLSHVSNISFRFIEGEGLLIHLDMQGVAVSTGSACSSGTLEPSPVIKALGRDEELARGAIRFSFGKDNCDDDVDFAVNALVRAVESLRAISPLTRAMESVPSA